MLTTYNQQMHHVFHSELHLKTPTYFEASMHHHIISMSLPCIKVIYSPTNAHVIVLKTILKFTLK
jgi:hypothetical protein